MNKSIFSMLQTLLAAASLAMVWSASAQAEIQQGKQYTLVSPAQPTETGKNIEVVEFFSYACPHCHELESSLIPWVKKLPRDTTFRRIPAVFNDVYMTYAKVFYTMEALGLMDKEHTSIFDAIHEQNINLANEKTLLDWVGKQGIDSKKFADVYASFSIVSKAQRAKQLTRSYGISGVPSLVVEGVYLTSASQTGGNDKMFSVLDELVNKVRQQRGGKS